MGEQDPKAWAEMERLLDSGDLAGFWNRYRNYLIANHVVSNRRALLIRAMLKTAVELEAAKAGGAHDA